MFRCPLCNSEDYHIVSGFGSNCDECGFSTDGEGQAVGGDEDD